MNGWICLYKPEGVTSAQWVNQFKRLLPKGVKVGHAGTLDKFACGVLPLAVGHATKTVPLIMGAKKAYTFTVRWGIQTTTDDRDGDILSQGMKIPGRQDIEAILPYFMGTLQQVPPLYSAIKVQGKRASDRVRLGESLNLFPRDVEIYQLNIVTHEENETTFYMECSKGTYVRSLARDMAAHMETVGYVSYLRRDYVGKFSLKMSILLEKDITLCDNKILKLASKIIPIRTVLDDIPAVFCTESAMFRLSKGQRLSVNLPNLKMAFVVDDHDVISIGYVNDGFFYPKNVFINGA